MDFFSYDGKFGIYDNPYFIMLFFAVLFCFLILFLIKSDDKEARIQKNADINNSIQQHTSAKFDIPDKVDKSDIPTMPYKTNTPDRNEALEIIKIRYAKGEISEEEFEKIKKAII